MKELKMMGGGGSVDSDHLTASPAHVRAGDIFFGSGSDEEQVGELPDRAKASGATIGGKPLYTPDDYVVANDSDGLTKIAMVPPVGDYPGGTGAYVGVTPDSLGITAEHIANKHSVCNVIGEYGADGNITRKDVRAGMIGYNKDGKVEGGAVDYGNVSKTLACGESYAINEGIYGEGKVTAKDLASQTKPDSGYVAAVAAQILKGFMAFVNGKKIPGSMPDNTGIATNGTVPGINSTYKTVPTREADGLQLCADTNGVKRINMCPPQGYYQGSGSSYVNRPASDFGAAAPSEVLKDKTFTSTSGIKSPGTMKNITADAAITHTSSNATKVVLGDTAYQSKNSDETERVQIRYNSTAGYITANTLFAVPLSIMANALAITAKKIAKGNKICGIDGTEPRSEPVSWSTSVSLNCTGYSGTAGDRKVSLGVLYSGWDTIIMRIYPSTEYNGPVVVALSKGKSQRIPITTIKYYDSTYRNAWASIARSSSGEVTLSPFRGNVSGTYTVVCEVLAVLDGIYRADE
ncbi:MAG: hypothetical protein PHV18_04240 [Lachnospiraceae bacterium]|nr:hypothetical protein [Lachnospiraceae bacterium]